MTAIRFILLKISFFICLASFGQINDTWDVVKVGTTDMQKIYVGNTLVWEKPECQYGDLANYEVYSFWDGFFFSSCTDYPNISSVSEAKSAIDNYRNSSCGSFSASGTSGALWNTTVDSYVLVANPYDGAVCILSGVSGYFVLTRGTTIPDPATIIEVTNGVITYSESY